MKNSDGLPALLVRTVGIRSGTMRHGGVGIAGVRGMGTNP